MKNSIHTWKIKIFLQNIEKNYTKIKNGKEK